MRFTNVDLGDGSSAGACHHGFALLGLEATGAEDQRPWLRHGAWPADFFPLRHDADPAGTLTLAK